MVLVVIDFIVFGGMGVVADDSPPGSHPEMFALRGENFDISGVKVKSLLLQDMRVGLTGSFLGYRCAKRTSRVYIDKAGTGTENDYNGEDFICKFKRSHGEVFSHKFKKLYSSCFCNAFVFSFGVWVLRL